MTFRWIGKSSDGKSVTINKLEGCPIAPQDYATPEWMSANADIIRIGVVLDVETTGLNQNDDSVIEIGLQQFLFNRSNGDILGLLKSYNEFQDPGKALSPEIISLTGITDEMLAEKSIDWLEVDRLLEKASVVIAHNAKFDRPFIERRSKVSAEKIWACSYKQINWSEHGFNSSKLELLNIYHGFFTDSHRALHDVEALLYLLSLPAEKSQKTYLNELLENARRPMTQVIASSSPFESKDHLKTKGYSWDATNRFWFREIFKDEVNEEVQWLEEYVYIGAFRGFLHDIPLTDVFKAKS